MIRRAATVVGTLAAGAAAVGIAVHFLGVVSTTAARLAAFTPLFVVLAAAAVLLLAVTRQRTAAAFAVLVLLVGVWSQVPLFTRAPIADAGPTDHTVRLLQANIRLGQADAAALVRTVTEQRADVLTLIELTPEAVERLSAAGLGDVLPYSFVRPRGGGGGAGVFSRFPLSEGQLLPGFELNNVTARADVPGLGPIAVYALHPLPPYPEPADRWASELRKLRGVFAAQELPLVVGADFNSTFDHRQYREMLHNSSPGRQQSLIDSAEQLGAGVVATYPAGRRYPALLAIDKILTRGGVPVAMDRVDIPGSDHHGVIGDIRFAAIRSTTADT